VHGAVLGVAQALAAVGVEQVGSRHVAGADGGIGFALDFRPRIIPRGVWAAEPRL
jgi:hypothetical protein